MIGADNAWEEGSALPARFAPDRYPQFDSDDPEQIALAAKTVIEKHDLGFSLFTDEHAEKYPLLARALADMGAAYSTKIEWLYDKLAGGRTYHILDFNWSQIQRHPVKLAPGDDESAVRDEYFDRLCSDMESVLWDGVRSGPEYGKPYTLPLHTSGGVRELLGRDPNENDIIRLRCLREPFWRVTRYPEECGGDVVCEWIVEFSVEAIPQEPARVAA